MQAVLGETPWRSVVQPAMKGRERKKRLTVGDGDPRHGWNGYSNYYCRCDICRKANADAHYAYMQRHPDQQRKSRDRSRAARGLTEDEQNWQEVDYLLGKHRSGRTRDGE